MTDFYGNEYVESRWTRFVFLWQLQEFETKRSRAFETWGDNVVRQLESEGQKVNSHKEITANFAGNILTLHIQVPAIGAPTVSLSINHYDVYTKRKINPAKQIISDLRWKVKAGV